MHKARTWIGSLLSIPLVALCIPFYVLVLCQIEREHRIRQNIITDRDYGYDVSGKNFLYALAMVAALALIIIAFLLVMGEGRV